MDALVRDLRRESCAVRVLRPGGSELLARFGAERGLTQLLSVPEAIRPRLDELRRIAEPRASLALASRGDGVVVGLFDGDAALRHLRFAVDGRVARGKEEPFLYVATVEDLPPF
jgi:hypothetical protein